MEVQCAIPELLRAFGIGRRLLNRRGVLVGLVMKGLRLDDLCPAIVGLGRLDKLGFSLAKVLDEAHALELVIGALEPSHMRLLEVALSASKCPILLVEVKVVD